MATHLASRAKAVDAEKTLAYHGYLYEKSKLLLEQSQNSKNIRVDNKSEKYNDNTRKSGNEHCSDDSTTRCPCNEAIPHSLSNQRFNDGTLPRARCLAEQVECGFYTVPENYDEPQGRTLDLYVVRLTGGCSGGGGGERGGTD